MIQRIAFLILLIDSLSATLAAQMPQAKVFHVSKSGNDHNKGTAGAPFLTIGKAVSEVRPGETVIVHQGIYRESILLHTGGNKISSQVKIMAAPHERVQIKGSKSIGSWIKGKNGVWSVTLPVDFFEGVNPFSLKLAKDSSYLHAGGVYCNDKPLTERENLSQVEQLPGSWYCKQVNGQTVLTAHFKESNPNLSTTEISLRPYAFCGQKGVDFININGFKISQFAMPAAALDAEQPGAIAINGGSHWVIQNCTISDCASVGISIGQTGHSYPNANPGNPEYRDLSQDTGLVGHHTIRHNHIFRCGQAGIFGLLQPSFGEISDNLIEDINNNSNFPSLETAGIRLGFAIDVQIVHNLIRRVHGGPTAYGMFIGPLFQGMRMSKNIISTTDGDCVFLFNSHGPALVDRNIFAGNGKSAITGLKMSGAEANVFIGNLFMDCVFSNGRMPGKTKATSSFLPHSLVIKQTIPALAMDDRWFANIFTAHGLSDLPQLPDCQSNFNAFVNGAKPSTWGDDQSKMVAGNADIKLINSGSGIYLKISNLPFRPMHLPLFDGASIGFFALAKQFIESPNGKPICLDKDFEGNSVTANEECLPGPIAHYTQTGKKNLSLFKF